jgi:hypothetical protein
VASTSYKCSSSAVVECNQISGACKSVETCSRTCIYTTNPYGAYCSGTKAIKTRDELEPAAAAYNCYKDCTYPWSQCVLSCSLSDGLVKDCLQYCNCNLFSDPNSQCRRDGGE